MKKLCLVVFTAVIANFLSFSHARAAEGSAYQMALFNPLQIVNEQQDIRIARINFIYGVNGNVSGLDFGLINQVDGDQKGLQIGFFNTTIRSQGVQIGLINRTNFLEGVQIGILNFHTEGMREFFPIVNFAF